MMRHIWPLSVSGEVHAVWTGLAYGDVDGGIFVASSYNVNPIMTSDDDGLTWTKRTAPVSGGSVVFGNNFFVVAGRNGGIMTSHDGSIWSNQVYLFQ